MNCIAVDDESLALDLLVDNIQQIPYLKLVKRCKNAFEAMDALRNEQVDLMFLDIQMPGITGVQLLQGLSYSPMVIFITAYDQYALEGFNLDVVDYLLKPVAFERFLKATNKAYELFSLRKQEIKPAVENDYFFVHADYSLVKIKMSEIMYVEGLKDYLKIYLAGQSRPVVTRMTMKSLEENLPVSQFVRVHRSYIVALDKIDCIRNQKIKLGEVFIPISEHYSEAFLSKINLSKIE
ncbi:LytTR family DNA-binding domain-containing protein [Cytophagaceae bacterium BD1B2-1]|uniref:LytTR family DNA-binding domain-containing protein n=2 Tax=Xanthocytophaga agilis TaxID=3048010 RepID=A0AAE3R5W0_9BACT|nr:LytTR family DNA-binding domain-containing protein [Xanthocytophaga agilis]